MATCISAKALAEALGMSEEQKTSYKACSLVLPATILAPDLQEALKIAMQLPDNQNNRSPPQLPQKPPSRGASTQKKESQKAQSRN